MKLLLQRSKFGDDSTLGELWLAENGAPARRLCYTLEDELRELKVPGETAIPTGIFEVLPRDAGGMTKGYRDRYGEMHVGMAHLQNVPNFKYVYIHTGNSDDHTEGCILVGESFKPTDEGRGNYVVINSRSAYVPVYKLIAEAWAKGQQVFITVTNEEVTS